jgi:hypothetical protein
MPYSLLEFEVRTVSRCEFPILRDKVGPRQISQPGFHPFISDTTDVRFWTIGRLTLPWDYFTFARYPEGSIYGRWAGALRGTL